MISPKLNVPQSKFLAMPQKFKGFVAGYGCLRGSTLIATEHGLMAIQNIKTPMRVLSWNEKKHQFELALTGGAFAKGEGYLYQVCTQQGEFVASEHHHVFCADGSYQRVDALCVGDKVQSFSTNLHQTNLALAPLSLHAKSQRLTQILANSMGRYADAARRYGQHLHQTIESDQQYKRGLTRLDERHEANGQYCLHVKHSEHALHDNLSALLFQMALKAAHLKPPLLYSTIKTSDIVRITRLDKKEVYFDLQVLNNNNYVTADGAIHHNSGKTWVGCADICGHKWNAPKVPSGYFAPTYPQIRDIFYPTIEECAHSYGLKVEIKTGNKEVHFYNGSTYRGTTICRSMDNPNSIVGFKIGKALVDEIDTQNGDKAHNVWRKIIARLRANGNHDAFDEQAMTLADEIEIVRNTNGISVTTTPEGFKFTYEQFKKKPSENPDIAKYYGLIQASTYDNEKNLPPDYINSLRESYPPQLIEAYLNGQFVNLASGSVYPEYNRELNHSDATIQDGEALHIGMDFNVLRMAAAVHVIRDGDPIAVDELTGIRDTPAMAESIKGRYPNHTILIYPDASGQNTSSKSSSVSDHSILIDAGFTLYTDKTNPLIRDRVNAVNAMILNGAGERRYKINTRMCPELVTGFEQQIYDKNGMPDKTSGLDHLIDASGYIVSRLYPIVKPVTQSNLRMSR